MTISHRSRLLAVLTAASLTLAACGSDDPEAGGVDPDPTTEQDDTIGDVTPDPNGEATEGYTLLVPRSDLISLEPGTVDEIIVDPDNDQQLLLHFEGAAEPCSGAAVSVEETDTSITIDFQIGLDPNVAAMTCIAQVFDYEIVIPLDAPVGDRSINVAG